MIRLLARMSAMAGLGFGLAACAAKEALPQFYILTPPNAADEGSRKGASVYIRRVQVPGYLARNSLVTIRAGNQVDYAASARWAEPLDQGVARAVAESLNRFARVRASAFSPNSPPGDHARNVEIRLDRFEGSDTGEVFMTARYEVFSGESSEPQVSRTFQAHRTGWQPGDYAGLTRLLSDEVADLGRQIGRAL
ncbi:MAG TPA: PqiC family protein [Chthoniobacterales bacterium]